MTRQNIFKIKRIIFILYAIAAYHVFWVNIGKEGFDFGMLVILLVIIFVTMIADGVSKSKDISLGLSIVMMIIYALPFIVYMVTTIFSDPVSASTTSNLDISLINILAILPWQINLLLSFISIFCKNTQKEQLTA